jgi:hypothetical protein
MDCPECGGRLADYRLGDRDAVACEDCGYVGIDAEHRGRPAERESWDEALERFHRRQAAPSTGDETDAEVAGDVAPADGATDGDTTGSADGGTGEDVTADESGAIDESVENRGPPEDEADRERPAAVNGSVETGDADE